MCVAADLWQQRIVQAFKAKKKLKEKKINNKENKKKL